MVKYIVSQRRPRILSPASVASTLVAIFIVLGTLRSRKITAWSPGGYGVSGKGAGPNANARQLVKTSPRLLRLGLKVGNFSLDRCIQTWRRLPIWIKVSYSSP